MRTIGWGCEEEQAGRENSRTAKTRNTMRCIDALHGTEGLPSLRLAFGVEVPNAKRKQKRTSLGQPPHPADDDVLDRNIIMPAARGRFHLLDLFPHIHAGDDFAECRATDLVSGLGLVQ